MAHGDGSAASPGRFLRPSSRSVVPGTGAVERVRPRPLPQHTARSPEHLPSEAGVPPIPSLHPAAPHAMPLNVEADQDSNTRRREVAEVWSSVSGSRSRSRCLEVSVSFLKQNGIVSAVTLGLCAQLVPGTLEAQPGLLLGQLRSPAWGSDIAGSVLENADQIDLTPGQVESLEALQSNSEERAGAARERLETWRAELSMVREAAESIRSDVRATMAELRTILTVEQMRGLRRLSPQMARSRPGDRPERMGFGRDRSFRSRGWPANFRRDRRR